MRVIIAGSRSITDMAFVFDAITLFDLFDHEITEVVSGTAEGVDRIGEQWAEEHCVAVQRFPADWKLHGKSAGYKRNEEMAEYADALLAIWDEESKGTKHMIDIAEREGLEVAVVYYEETT